MKKLFFAAVCAFLSVSAMAQVTCSIDDFTIGQGEKQNVAFVLNNGDSKFSAFQFDLKLPAGVTVESVYDEDEEEDVFSVALASDRANGHGLRLAKVDATTYRFVCFSSENKNLKGSEGALVNMTLVAAADAAMGDAEGAIVDAKFTPKSGTSVTFDKVPFKVTISEATAIKTVKAGVDANAPVYNLAGQKVNKNFKGVVIQNGKKVVK